MGRLVHLTPTVRNITRQKQYDGPTSSFTMLRHAFMRVGSGLGQWVIEDTQEGAVAKAHPLPPSRGTGLGHVGNAFLVSPL